MLSNMIRAAALSAVLLIGSPALGATYLVYVPTLISMGGQPAEVYGVLGFSAHDGMTGAPLADAALAELRRVIPEEMSQVTVEVAGNTAVINLRSGDPNAPMPDRVVGAVFHTLKMAGLKEIRFGDEPLDATTFSRGALAPVFPFVGALPPMQLAHGYVKVGTELWDAEEFRRRFAARDKHVAAACLRALLRGSPEAKLAILNRITQLPLKDKKKQLILRLRDKDKRVRLKVLELLDGARDQKSLNALEIVVARDPLPEAQMIAARILVAAGKKGYEKYLLLEDLKSNDASVVVQAAEKLISIADPKMAPGMLPLARHTSPDVRAVAVRALHVFKAYALLEELVEAKDVNMDVAQSSARILTDEAAGRQRALGIIWLLTNGARDQAAHAAKKAGKARVAGTTEALGVALTRPESEVTFAAALALFVLPSGNKGERLLDWQQAQTVPWGVAMIVGGGYAIAKGFATTGLATWLGDALAPIAALPLPVIVLLVVLFMTFITEINSNTATASIFLPVLATMATAGHTHPFLLMIPATFACSCAFMLPSGTGPNAVIFGSGQVTIPQMSRAGLRMNFISVVMLSVIMVLFAIPLLDISGTPPAWATLP